MTSKAEWKSAESDQRTFLYEPSPRVIKPTQYYEVSSKEKKNPVNNYFGFSKIKNKTKETNKQLLKLTIILERNQQKNK